MRLRRQRWGGKEKDREKLEEGKEPGSLPFRERGIEEEEKDKETERQAEGGRDKERASETPAEGKEKGQGTGDWRQTEGLTDTPKDHRRQRGDRGSG